MFLAPGAVAVVISRGEGGGGGGGGGDGHLREILAEKIRVFIPIHVPYSYRHIGTLRYFIYFALGHIGKWYFLHLCNIQEKGLLYTHI